jgi:hypothetical protein
VKVLQAHEGLLRAVRGRVPNVGEGAIAVNAPTDVGARAAADANIDRHCTNGSSSFGQLKGPRK